jgi:hypothetical protein
MIPNKSTALAKNIRPKLSSTDPSFRTSHYINWTGKRAAYPRVRIDTVFVSLDTLCSSSSQSQTILLIIITLSFSQEKVDPIIPKLLEN